MLRACWAQLSSVQSTSRKQVVAASHAAIRLIRAGSSAMVADAIKRSIVREGAGTEAHVACLYTLDATLNELCQESNAGAIA